MGQITLDQVTKSFGDVLVIPPLDLEINEGEFVVFVGPSGCGKSTLLRLIAGLEDTTFGHINIDGNDATDLPPAKRSLAMVFDEPLSNLDAALRAGMRLEIMELHKKLATTMIYVTHDQIEAMTMADKIVVLQAGVIEQVGSDTFIHMHDTGLTDMMTVRITGDIQVKHGDDIYLTPAADQMHRFDAQGLGIA